MLTQLKTNNFKLVEHFKTVYTQKFSANVETVEIKGHKPSNMKHI